MAGGQALAAAGGLTLGGRSRRTERLHRSLSYKDVCVLPARVVSNLPALPRHARPATPRPPCHATSRQVDMMERSDWVRVTDTDGKHFK